nr:hypothetical protein [Tanacetum cinerariifolium]
MLDHQDKHMRKAQVHVSKSFAISDVQALPRRKYYCQNDKFIKCDGNDKVISEPSYEGEPNTQPIILSYADVQAILLSKDEAQESKEDILGAGYEINNTPQFDETQHQSDNILKKYDDTLPLTERQLVKYLRKVSCVLFERITEDQDQTDQLVEAFISSLKKVALQLLISTKAWKSSLSFLKILTIQSKMILSFDFSTLLTTVNNIQVHAFKQEEASTAWMKSSTNMAWNLGSRIFGLERAQNHIKLSMSSLQEDTSSIKSMMTKMYNAFRGQSSSAPSSSITPTFAITDTLVNVEGENATHTATEEPLSHTEGRLILTSKKSLKNQSNQ